jgi:hypothetical protein
MGRIVNVFLVLLMIAGAGVTYEMKDRASVAAKAEWSVLSQPARLQAVISRYQDHFKLAPFSASQVATLDEIPLKPAEPPVALPKAVADAGPAAAE